jgi:hypothetical protein
MSRQSHTRDALITYFPMFIATISVVANLYQAWLFARSVEVMQRNVDRFETMRACRDVIDSYFQVKLKVGLVADAAGGAEARTAESEAANAVAKFGALGTYLANLSDDAARERYTGLTHELSRVVLAARSTPRAQADKLFAKADELFTHMNDDCVRRARTIM